MAVGKKRSVNGGYPVTAYDPAKGRKVHVGTYETMAEAREAFRDASVRLTKGRSRRSWTVKAWSGFWLEEMPRPEETTNRHNRQQIGCFVKQYGSRLLDRVDPDEAEDFAQEHPSNAKAVAAMFNDARRKRACLGNPFDGVRIAKGPGRANIDPLTEREVDRLGQVAIEKLGFFGVEFRTIILTAGWLGMRPAEIGGWERRDLIFTGDRVETHVRRQQRTDALVPYTKTKKHRIISVAPAVRDAVAMLPRDREAVFLTPRGKRFRPSSFRYYWNQVRLAFEHELPASHWLSRRLAVDPQDHLDLYELRHFCGSYLAEKGLSSRDIADHLGNSPAVCERIYVHPYRDAIRDRTRTAFEDRAVVDLREVREQSGRRAVGGSDAS